jgi:hypothetical protein
METEPDRVFAPGGESWNTFHERVLRMLDRLATEYADQTVVAVCHAGVIIASMRGLLGVPTQQPGARLRPANTGLTEWEYDADRDRWTLHTFNDVRHLQPPGPDDPIDNRDSSVAAARGAARVDELGEWVTRFLASPGSDNPVLAEKLAARPRWWYGPVPVPIDRLQRLAGPSGELVLCAVDDDFWGDNVDDMAQQIEDGWEPPPLIVTARGDELVLEDGNHRVESLRRAGVRRYWAVVNFESPEARDQFARSDALRA